MSFVAAEGGSQEGEHDFFGQNRPDDPAAQREHVDVIVLDGLVRRVGVVGQSAAHTFHLVGGDGGSGPRPADDDPAIGAAFHDGSPHGGSNVGVVDGFVGMGSEVGDGMTRSGDGGGKELLEFKAGVIGGDGNAHVAAG